MAYSFSDLYRTLRISMRLNGVVVGLGFGLLLLWGPKSVMEFLRIGESGPIWPIRLAGAALIGSGGLSDNGIRRTHHPSTGIDLGHRLQWADRVRYCSSPTCKAIWRNCRMVGSLTLVFVVAICLIGAVLPVRYLRAEYRAP